MKLLACVLVVALCGYIGRMLSKRALQRLELIREYQSCFVYLSDRIVGINLELGKALETAGEGELAGFFRGCSAMLSEHPQSRFSSIWKQCFESMRFTYLTKEDVSVVISGGDAIESLCMNPSEKQASGYIKRLAAYAEVMETEKRKRCRLYNTSGMLAGLLIALLMI